jgi:hypothetical protein
MGADAVYPFRLTSRQYELGTCIGGITSVDYALTKVSGRTALAHRILRRLTTPRGGLFYAPTYGYDLAELIGSAVPMSVVEHRMTEQILYEEEVEDARCTATLANGTLSVDIQCVDADGPFELAISASDITIAALLDNVEFFKESA